MCASVSLSCVNRQAYRPGFWHAGQVEGYLGQGHRSKVKVTRSQNVHFDILLASGSLDCGPAKEETQEYDVGCFQSVCGFISYTFNSIKSLFSSLQSLA